MQKVRTSARHGPAADFAKGKQPPSFAVVSESELDNLKAFLDHDPNAAARKQAEERAALKARSDERVKHWPNLIETIRLRKEKEREERLEQEEAARKVLDEKERDYQAGLRRGAIDKANKILYSQDDRVKTFTSKLFLSTVLDERAQQVILERQKKEAAKQREYKWAMIQQEKLERMDREEEEKKVVQRGKAVRTREDLKEQLGQVRERKLREREEARQEGRHIREAAERAVEQKKEQDELKRQKAVEVNRQYMEENRRQRHLKEMKLQEEENELNRIKLFAQLKEDQMLERKRRAEDKFNHEQSKRQEMIAIQSSHLEAMASEAEERVLTHIRDQEKEREEKERIKREKQEQLQKEIDISRTKQLAQKQHQKREVVREKERVKRIQQMQQSSMMEEEIEDRNDQRSRNKQLQYYLTLQMKEKEEKKKAEALKSIEEGRLMQESYQKEEEMFQNYVNSVMGTLQQKKGLNATGASGVSGYSSNASRSQMGSR